MRFQIVEELRNVDQMEYGQKPVEWEAQVFNRSRTREEYVKLVATLIWKLRDYNKKVYFNFESSCDTKILEVVIVRTNLFLAYAFLFRERSNRLCFVS